MSTYRPSTKTLPFVFLALFGILYIYDAGLEQEEILPEIISETISFSTQNTPSVQTKKIHTVQEGENLYIEQEGNGQDEVTLCKSLKSKP